MLIGANSPTQGFTDRARHAAEVFGPGIMLWLPSAGPGDAVRYPDCVHLVRLDNWTVDITPAQYAANVAPQVVRWRSAVPDAIFVLGNEPDIEAGHSGEQVTRYAGAMKVAFPGIRVANPPLSVERSMQVHAEGCDVVLMHSYFERQHPESMTDRQFGKSYTYALQVAGDRPVYVAEFNVVQTNCPIDWPDRNRQAAAWLDQAEADGVAGVCFFLLDATPDWVSFDVGPEAAADILARRAPPAPVPAPIPAPHPPVSTDIPALLDAIGKVADDDHMFNAMLMGAALETSLQDVAQYGGGPGRGYWQIEAGPGGSHEGQITEEDALDPYQAAIFMAPDYRHGCETITDWTSDAASAYATAAYRAERPAVMYPGDRVTAAWALIRPYIRGGGAVAKYEIVTPVDCPVLQGSDGAFSHGGASPGFFAIDYGCAIGTPIRAVADGTVGAIYWQDSNPISLRTGHSVWIDHDCGYSTFSCHMTERYVSTGDRIVQGQIIGTTGDPASQPGNGYGDGPHLHWEIWDTASHVRVKMEDLEAAGIAGPWTPQEEDAAMFHVDGKIDDGRLDAAWYGTDKPTKTALKTMPRVKEHGIPQRWEAEFRAGNGLGMVRTPERAIPNAGGAVIQYFANGWICWYPDGTTTVN
jgi:murein DD-endopeptidase MepM/ murein hydrolase activator NlpD